MSTSIGFDAPLTLQNREGFPAKQVSDLQTGWIELNEIALAITEDVERNLIKNTPNLGVSPSA